MASEVGGEDELESLLSVAQKKARTLKEELEQAEERADQAEERAAQAKKKEKTAVKELRKWKDLYDKLRAETEAKEQEQEQGEIVPDVSRSSRVKREASSNPDEADEEILPNVPVKREAISSGDDENNQKRIRREQEDEDDGNTTAAIAFENLSPEMQGWIGALNLQKAYATGDEGLGNIDVNNYALPKSFKHVFLLTDYLFPPEEDEESCFRLLFEKDSRPGIKVRQRLRTIKEKRPNDPIVSWHNKKGQAWNPPNASALKLMVRLIHEMVQNERE